MSPEQTGRLLRDQAMVFEGLRFNADAAALWHSDIGHLSHADADAAFAAHRRDPQRGGYTPKPADILAAHNGSKPKPRTGKPTEIPGCARCDHGWNDTRFERRGLAFEAVAPCPRCRPTLHERNLAGEYLPDPHLRDLAA